MRPARRHGAGRPLADKPKVMNNWLEIADTSSISRRKFSHNKMIEWRSVAIICERAL